jgi:hypothetical protein
MKMAIHVAGVTGMGNDVDVKAAVARAEKAERAQAQRVLHDELVAVANASPMAVNVSHLKLILQDVTEMGLPQEEVAVAEAKLKEAFEKQAVVKEGEGCYFWFLLADKLRNAEPLPYLPSLQDLRLTRPDWLELKLVRFVDACRGAYVSEYLAVSHRWDHPDQPDPSGVQLREVLSMLDREPSIKYIFYDYCSMPQGEKTKQEKYEFNLLLPNINLLYIGCRILILMDRSYLSRFWTQFEAWLSFQRAYPHGLATAAVGDKRTSVVCVHGAPQRLRETLAQEWAGCTARIAHDKLSQPDVHVTNSRDKETQLPKILVLDEQVRGYSPPVLQLIVKRERGGTELR